MKIFCSAINFGMGPAGKLASIIRQGPQWQWIGVGDPLSEAFLEEHHLEANYWTKDADTLARLIKQHAPTLAVVVLDAPLANTLKSLGLPVIYVDSLPFLWTEADPIPFDVDVYAAQITTHLPKASWPVLRKISGLTWVSGIIDTVEEEFHDQDHSEVVINFGGVHSPLSYKFAYIDIILPSLLSAIRMKGYTRITIASGAHAAAHIRRNYSQELAVFTEVCIGEFAKADFLTRVKNAALFVTSPGLTTLLETDSFAVARVILPPQNLSQYQNTKTFKRFNQLGQVCSWPVTELEDSEIQELLPQGEDFVVHEISQRISALTTQSYIHELLEQRLSNHIVAATAHYTRSGLLQMYGDSGAVQIRDLIGKLSLKSASTQELHNA